jgi:hypothetical protein
MKVTRVDFNYAVHPAGVNGGMRMSVGTPDLKFAENRSISIAKVDGAVGVLCDFGAPELTFVPMANVRSIRVERGSPNRADSPTKEK